MKDIIRQGGDAIVVLDNGWEVRPMETDAGGVAVQLTFVGATGTRRTRIAVFDKTGKLRSLTEPEP